MKRGCGEGVQGEGGAKGCVQGGVCKADGGEKEVCNWGGGGGVKRGCTLANQRSH